MFKNKYNVEKHGLAGFIQWKIQAAREKIKRNDIVIQKHHEKWQPQEDALAFVNHSTFYMQIDGLAILTDPIWSDFCSPVQGLGPKRQHAPGIELESLEALDVILISHNHYDHLDVPTLKELIKRFNPKIFVPKGDGALISSLGATHVKEFSWWDEESVEGVDFTFTPAEHFSGRNPFDQNKSLWGGWLIGAHEHKIFFAGDTGYSYHFKEIKDFAGKIDLALLPIGAFRPRWFMKPVHMNPEDAVKAHLLLDAERSLGMHFGTFKLADDLAVDALCELEVAKKRHGLAPDDFLTLKPGEQLCLKGHRPRATH